jgi:hypothetical protein
VATMPPSVNLFFILGESILTVGLLSSHLRFIRNKRTF